MLFLIKNYDFTGIIIIIIIIKYLMSFFYTSAIWWLFTRVWVTVELFESLLSIQANLNNFVSWMVSILPLISSSFKPLSNPLGTVPSELTTTYCNYFTSFSYQRSLKIFHWNSNDSKSPQISWTRLTILNVLNKIGMRMVSVILLI